MRLPALTTLMVAAVTSAGCSYLPFERERAAPAPAPLTAAPSGSVSAAPLPPPGGVTTGIETPPAGTGTQVAAATPTNVQVGRTDLLGGWTITAAGDSC